jgi:molybdopterin synthase catalytic subunit
MRTLNENVELFLRHHVADPFCPSFLWLLFMELFTVQPSILLSAEPLSVQACLDAVAAPECGAVDVFIGNVRNTTHSKLVERLEYEAYEPMAVKEMWRIAENVQALWTGARVAIHHRTGVLRVGESAVVIAVATPHRVASFEACKYAIDTLKQTVPIWKKEVFADGEVWVMPTP